MLHSEAWTGRGRQTDCIQCEKVDKDPMEIFRLRRTREMFPEKETTNQDFLRRETE